MKIDETKFFVCPLCAISADSWDLIRQVNLCMNSSGDIIHLPEPEFSILDQSPRFLTAVDIIRRERNSEWYHQKMQEWAKKNHEG